MERLMDKISFDASEMDGQTVNIDAAYVIDALGEVIENEDFKSIHSVIEIWIKKKCGYF